MQLLKNILKKYYQKDLNKLYKHLVPKSASKIIFNKKNENHKLKLGKKYDYVIVDNHIGNIKDVQSYFDSIKKYIRHDGRIIITYYNYLWEPILKIASYFGLRQRINEQNWLDNDDIANLLFLSDYDVITRQKRFFGITTYLIAKPKKNNQNGYSVSIIIPARNESGNILHLVKKIPKFGNRQEIIFIEGNSQDDTWEVINKVVKKYKNTNKTITVKCYKQKGRGKTDAVRLGFKKATGDILMIYDADQTVTPKDLIKFYNALCQDKGEFANGTRLVYPMEKDAMQTLNKFFNKFFSIIFTWILGQRFKDTLCGTKTFFRKDYLKFERFIDDPFGDFELIFGAIKNNLKVVEIPVRYKERIYGSTNINRFKNGLQLFKMTFLGYMKFKSW